VLADATFHELLLAYDRDLADTARLRVARGVAASFIALPIAQAAWPALPASGANTTALQLLLRVDGCRSRATPPSLRFLAARSIRCHGGADRESPAHGTTVRRMRKLTALIVSAAHRRTLVQVVGASASHNSFWRAKRAKLMPRSMRIICWLR